jgi:hypothetical protein
MSDTEQAHLFGEPPTSKSSKAEQGDNTEKPYTVAQFVREFNKLAPHKHRYDVFRDFITIAAISIYNAVARDENYEAEYMKIIGGYKKEEVVQFAHFLAHVTMMLEPAPSDVLGEIYTALDLCNAKTGQYFTPWPIAEFMAQIAHGDELANLNKPFLTVCEPACGSGVMVLAFAKVLISQGHNPCKRMWAKCIDIDRLAALMCYIQLSLWNIPAIVYVGNGLSDEYREAFATPAHYFGCWDSKLKMVQMVDAMCEILNPAQENEGEEGASAEATEAATNASTTSSEPPKPVSQNPMQFDFEF